MKPVRILFVEDVPADAMIVDHQLRKAGLHARTKRVDTRKDFLHELTHHPPDIILSDHGLPSFDGFAALELAHARCPDVPFIFVTDCPREKLAARAPEPGATDYVTKNQLARLAPAIQRALKRSRAAGRSRKRVRPRSTKDVVFRRLVQGVRDYAIVMLDPEGLVLTWSPGAKAIHGFGEGEILGRHFSVFYPREGIAEGLPELALKSAEAHGHYEENGARVARNGNAFLAHVAMTAVRNQRGRLAGFAHVTRPLAGPPATTTAPLAMPVPGQEEQYRQLMEFCPCALLVVGEQGEIVICNLAAERLFGATSPEQLLRASLDVVAPQSGGRAILGSLWEAHERGEPFIEQEFVTLDGQRVVVELSAVPLIFHGQPATQVIAHDISRRKGAERALTESEARKTAILETVLDAIVCFDEQGRVEEWNMAAQKIFGYTRTQALGQPVDELIIPKSLLQAYQDGVANYLATGAGSLLGRPIELTLRRADGTEFRAELAISRVAGNGPLRCTALVRDITERKRVEAALRQSEERFRLLMEGVKDYAIYILDPEGRIVTWNTGAERLEGYTADEVLGKPLATFFTPEDVANDVPGQALKQAAVEGQVSNEGWRMRKGGDRFWSQGVITALRDESGVLHGFAKIAHDKTREKKAQEEIRQLNATLEQRVARRTAELQAANEELEAFSYSVSHDLRAPLRHIMGYVEILQTETAAQSDENIRRYLETVADSAKQMGDLIDALLAFSRTGRAEMHQQDMDMNELVEEVAGDLARDATERRVEWRIPPLPKVRGDRLMLRQVLVNLLCNALKYTRPRDPARIEVGARSDNANFVFFVRDNGVGFDMRYAEKLFGVFQRLHHTEDFEGTGIGLANVRRIIHRHGGRTWAESRPDEGATFYFSLPRPPNKAREKNL